MAGLFPEIKEDQTKGAKAPLADRMRPTTLDEVVGQTHLLGTDGALRRQIESDHLPSLILWGPPGSGKTTIAKLVAHYTRSVFHSLSAVLSGTKELKEIIEVARRQQKFDGKRTILFIDEIHRWNKAQQDALLPHLEDGTITLIGATTENPSFEVIGPLLSRAKVYVLEPLSPEDLKTLVERAAKRLEVAFEPDALDYLVQTSDGDARRALNTLEIANGLAKRGASPDSSETGNRPRSNAARTSPALSPRLSPDGSCEAGLRELSDSPGEAPRLMLTLKQIEQAVQKKSLLYDKSGEEHYNTISAFIKSMRGSDPDAAVYYLARMLEAGEDPLFLARRMVIFASEDVGNADPQAIQVAISVMQAFDFVGMPEGWIPLAQGATYLASAPKSNASYMAYKKAKGDVQREGALPTPKHIRNAPTKLMKELGYGKDYQYPHDYEGNFVKENYLPEKLQGRRYYEPTENGYEKKIGEHLKKLRK